MTSSTAMPDRARRRRRARRRAVAAVQVTLLRARLRLLSLVRPAAADELAFQLWCTPPGSARRPDHAPRPGDVVRLPLGRGGDAVAEVWGDGPTVYLVHGWGGWRGQMGAFVAPLVAAGHRVVAVEAPGHGVAGDSFLGPGRSTIVEFFDAVEAAVERFGAPAAVVAHSMGTTVVAYLAAHHGLVPGRLVLVATAPPFAAPLGQMAATLRLPARAVTSLRARLEEILDQPLDSLDIERLPADAPTLLLHDRRDKEAPFALAERVAASWPDARLVPSDGLGHNRILLDAGAVRAAVEHITGRVPVA